MSSESDKKSIIALKGHPFTQKAELAKYIADSFKCHVLPLDHFLDYFQPCSSSNTCTPVEPQDLAFRVICQIYKSNLSSGLVKQIVIDPPLSSRSHLDQLIQLSSSLEQTRLIIIECKVDNIYEWETRFEEYHNRNFDKIPRWYKAKTWEDVEKTLRCGYDESYIVPKLVVDHVYDYISHKFLTPFMDAVTYMITRGEDDGPDLVVYCRWLQGQYLPSCAPDNHEFCRAGKGHYITNYFEEGLEFEVECKACEKQVMGTATYTCEYCSFALHKKCVELVDDNNKPSKNDNFNSLSKSRQMPSVIRHDCEQHFLSVVLSFLNPYEEFFPCKACWYAVESVWYSCKICCVAYHYECLTQVVVRVKDEHGGHHHEMLLHYSCNEAEDCMCDACFGKGDPERRDPMLWFYSCQECHYVTHLLCV